jgi:hypothetical protein
MMMPPKSLAKVVWIYGAITGVCVAILWRGASQLLGPILITLTMVAFLLVGLLAAKQTNRVRIGTLAGLVAGLTTVIILCVVPLLVQGGARLSLFDLTFPIMMLSISTGMGMLGGQIVQMINAPKGSAKIVWIHGVIGGVCLNIICVVANFLGPIGFILAIVLTMVALLLVGLLASKQTGRVRTGTEAGLIAGLTGGGTVWVTLTLVSLMSGSIPFNRLLNGLLNASVLISIAIGAATLVGVLLSLGAGLGSLGGLIGKMKAKMPLAGDPMSSPSPLQQEPLQYPLQQQ